MSDKTYLTADQLALDSFALARRIYDSGFVPDALVVLWRGGTPIGVIIHEFLRFKGIETYHTAIKCTSYTGIEARGEPTIENLDPVFDALTPDSRVLIIDDIFDTGSTARKVTDQLKSHTAEVRIAPLFYKPAKNRTDLTPDYYLHETDRWIVFPHELMGLSRDEIAAKDPRVHQLLFPAAGTPA